MPSRLTRRRRDSSDGVTGEAALAFAILPASYWRMEITLTGFAMLGWWSVVNIAET